MNKIFGDKLSQRDMFVMAGIIILVIIHTECFDYLFWNSVYGGWARNITGIMFFVWFLLFGNKNSKIFYFHRMVVLMMFLPFLSVVNSWALYGQSPFLGIKNTIYDTAVWVVYFLLHKYYVKETVILKTFFLIALFIAVIQIVQQFTYPVAVFGVYSAQEMIERGMLELAEERNGLWRFRISGASFFTMPIILVLWIRMRQKITNIRLFFISMFLVSIYLTLTRQILFCTVLTIFISFFVGQKRIHVIYMILIILCIYGLYFNYELLFGSLTELSTEQFFDDDYIRFLAAEYFFKDSLRNPLTFLLGYGLVSGDGAFFNYQKWLTQTMGYYVSDVGFIGSIWQFGIIYTIVVYCFLWKIFFKLKNKVPLYSRLMVIFVVLMSIMIFPTIGSIKCLIWACLLYICDLHISNSSLAMK